MFKRLKRNGYLHSNSTPMVTTACKIYTFKVNAEDETLSLYGQYLLHTKRKNKQLFSNGFSIPQWINKL